MLTGEGITIKRRALIENIEQRGDQKVCIYKDGDTGERAEVSSAEILCASARLANVEHLNLEAVESMPTRNTASRSMNCCRPTRSASSRSATC